MAEAKMRERQVIAFSCAAPEAFTPRLADALKAALSGRYPGHVLRRFSDLAMAPDHPALVLSVRLVVEVGSNTATGHLEWRHGAAGRFRRGPATAAEMADNPPTRQQAKHFVQAVFAATPGFGR